MLCKPSADDLRHCARRGVDAALGAGKSTTAELRAAALAEVLAAWPHIEPRQAEAAVSDAAVRPPGFGNSPAGR
ncbi:MAG: hypothetical protein QF578_00370 [Alphaproteobacteria bacterium]|jgi:hypothetical protein|nr:hypothetical protein [Alphaproteobacteria bacterium]MDP6814577.1 hypothetical protein [Alphaproteobacteria bacterium]